MKNLTIDADAEEREELAIFGTASLFRDTKGRLEIAGGTQEDQKRAIQWAEMVFGNNLRWYSRAHTRRIKLPRLKPTEKPRLENVRCKKIITLHQMG
ncbi:MAG: hypothetical protein JWQ04_318 [Pedosphaera sp.]|nr:hypothetical protein [Pedosphaera sp.]